MGLDFWRTAEADPSRLALVDPAERRVSAGDLLAGANRLVHGLRARGLRAGNAVAAVLPNSVEAVELYLAAAQAGWYLVPINYHLVGPEIAYIVSDSEASVLIAHERFVEACAAAAAELGWPASRCFSVGDIPGFVPYETLKEGQPASASPDRQIGRLMNYTSGTTGRPKGVRRPVPGLPPEEFDAWELPLPSYGLRPGGQHVHLCCTPWYHTAPMVFVAPSLHMAHTVVLMDRFVPERMLELIERYRVTHTLMVPTQFVRLLGLPEEVRRAYDLSSLELAVHGAAPCSPDVKRAMIEWWGPTITEYYASTEGGGTIAFANDWLRKPGTVGLPYGGTVIRVLDEQGQELPPGEVGTVYLKPGTGGFEYFKDQAKTAASYRSDFFTVGDVGYLDEDGYLFLSDRRSETIISGGVNIYPAEIEGVLVAHPMVADVAVFGIPNDEWGEEVRAVVQPAPGATPGEALAAGLLEYCQGRLARYKIPRSMDFADELPRDPNGKLYRRKLRDPYWAGRQRAI